MNWTPPHLDYLLTFSTLDNQGRAATGWLSRRRVSVVRLIALGFRLRISRTVNQESIAGLGFIVRFRLSPHFIRAAYTNVVPMQFS